MADLRVSALVYCTVCGRQKCPWGRSQPVELRLCNFDCQGYDKDPHPGTQWPEEEAERQAALESRGWDSTGGTDDVLD